MNNDKNAILFVEMDRHFYSKWSRKLLKAGFLDISIVNNPESIQNVMLSNDFNTVLLDPFLDGRTEDGLDLLQRVRYDGFGGKIVAVTGNPSLEMFIRCISAGADDFWVKGIKLDLVFEVTRLLGDRRSRRGCQLNFNSIMGAGFFRSLN